MISNKPDIHHTVQIGEKSVELFMSFGLLHEIIPVVRDIVNVGLISLDSDLRGQVLTLLFSERDERGKITEEANLFQLQITTDDMQATIEWVQGHLLDFFLAALESANRVLGPNLERLKTPISMPSGNGSPD